MKKRFSVLFICIFAFVMAFAVKGKAAGPTDEIVNYVITVMPNDDATVQIQYHVEWLVLESDGIGPLEWVKIGVPNGSVKEYVGLSDTVKSIKPINDHGNYMRIDLDRKYYEGETASFDFYIVQDNLYQVNKFEDGYTVYDFTPGWFDDIAVDNLIVFWANDNVYQFTPECEIQDGYNLWQSSLSPGEKVTITVTYPNDALGFDLTMTDPYDDLTDDYYDDLADDYHDDEGYYYSGGLFSSIITFVIAILSIFGSPIVVTILIALAIKRFISGAGFGQKKEKKITRTIVEYYPNCTSCGAVRKEGEKECPYCGKSFVKSETTVTEEDVAKNNDLKGFVNDGEFRYSSSPNVYVRVHSVYVPVKPVVRSGGSSGRGGGGGFHSSCVHSHCACACACACAGGGRAGCTNKDFYNTNLKLKNLEMRKK